MDALAWLNPAGWYEAVIFFWILVGGSLFVAGLSISLREEEAAFLLASLYGLFLPYSLMLTTIGAVAFGGGWLVLKAWKRGIASFSEEAQLKRRIAKAQRQRKLVALRSEAWREEEAVRKEIERTALQIDDQLQQEIDELAHWDMPSMQEYT